MYIHNEYIKHLEDLNKQFNVSYLGLEGFSQGDSPLTPQSNDTGMISITADGWTADTTKTGFLGMTAHWIEVKEDGKWVLREAVIGFKPTVGTHDGDNLGRYMMGLLDRVGITSKTTSKVCWFPTHVDHEADSASALLRIAR